MEDNNLDLDLDLDLEIEEINEDMALYGGSNGLTAQHFWAWGC